MPLPVPLNSWTRWPLREALSRVGTSPARLWLGRIIRALVLAALLWTAFTSHHLRGWAAVAGAVGILAVGVAFWGFFRATLRHLLWPSVTLLLLMEAGAFGFHEAGLRVPAVVLWCACAVTALERLQARRAPCGRSTDHCPRSRSWRRSPARPGRQEH
ncbi:hypothetical protein ABT381_32185, partial [Streptomyces sp. NPDC000151]